MKLIKIKQLNKFTIQWRIHTHTKGDVQTRLILLCVYIDKKKWIQLKIFNMTPPIWNIRVRHCSDIKCNKLCSSKKPDVIRSIISDTQPYNSKVNPLAEIDLIDSNLTATVRYTPSGPYRCVEAIFKYSSGN